MTAITDIIAREILDSRGKTGAHEAVELRDGDKCALPRQGRAKRPSHAVNTEIFDGDSGPRRRRTRSADRPHA